MKSGLDNAATWVLDTTRPDLMENWFDYLRDQVRRLREQIVSLAYGGLAVENMPEDLLAHVEKLAKQATYTHVLAQQAFTTHQLSWKLEVSERVTGTAARAISEMEDDLRAINKAHTLVADVCEKVDKLIFNRGRA